MILLTFLCSQTNGTEASSSKTELPKKMQKAGDPLAATKEGEVVLIQVT